MEGNDWAIPNSWFRGRISHHANPHRLPPRGPAGERLLGRLPAVLVVGFVAAAGWTLGGTLDDFDAIPPPPTPSLTPPIELRVEFQRAEEGKWVVFASGVTHLPAPDARLTLRGTGSLSDLVLAEESLALSRGQAFEHAIEVPSLAMISPVRLEFVFDAAPFYYLYSGYDIRAPSGREELPIAEPVLPGEGPGDGQAESPPQVGLELPGDPPGGALDATTTVQGTVQFKSAGGSTFVCRSCLVHIYDRDTGGEQFLGDIVADWNGYFSKVVDNTDGTGGVDVFVKVYTDTSMGRVIDANGNAWMNSTPDLYVNCPDNGICNLGTFTLQTTGNKARAFWIYRTLMYGWNEIRWNGPGEDIGQATVRFPIDNYPTSGNEQHNADVAHYHIAGEIHIGTNMSGGDIAAHEHGHHAMWKAYNWGGGTYWPPVNCVNTPYMDADSGNKTCAWVEGWANHFAIEVWDDPVFNWTGSWFNLESWTCSWTCGTPTGDQVVGRVAATVWDIVDTPNDGYDSNIDRSVTETWAALRHARSTNFNGYYNNWLAKGYSQQEFLNCANQNTIFY